MPNKLKKIILRATKSFQISLYTHAVFETGPQGFPKKPQMPTGMPFPV